MKNLFIAILIVTAVSAKAQQKTIPLYPGAAPGSESWTWNESLNEKNAFNERLVFNVSRPSLTVFPASKDVAPTGAAVIICPGGAFYFLSIDKEGNDVAAALSKKGITVFVLKYRVTHLSSDNPLKEFGDATVKPGFKMESLPVVSLAEADGKAAIAYVRAHAAEYSLKTDRIGIMGFSAGGAVATIAATNYTADSRPDFAAPIYPYLPAAMLPAVPADAPPLFIAAASDDELNKDQENTNLYSAWISAKRSAELHIYVKGGHAFGAKKQNIPTDNWLDSFTAWLNTEGFIKPLTNEKTEGMKNAENWANFQKYVEDRTHNDWAWIKKYEDDNTKIPPPSPSEKRVVFMGNSITENWIGKDPDFFKANGYIDRGIGGQTSSQMLVRFREDIINLHPYAVVISAGTNDIAQNTGYISLENIFGNIVSMAQLAKASGIIPIMTSILPASEFSWHRGLKPAEKIIKVNSWIKAYAAENHLVYVDYWSALVNDKKGLKVELAEDALVHPNLAGYKVMEPIVKKAIAEALK